MTNDDIKYRQGKTKKQVKDSEQLMFIASCGLGFTLFLIILYGIICG